MESTKQIRSNAANWLGNRLRFRASIVLIAIFVGFAFWYYEGDNFTDHNIPGTYIADGSNRSNVLLINSNHTYKQTAFVNGETKHASGIWRLGGNVDAHIVFKGSFLTAPAAAIGQDDHNAFGMFDNLFGFLTLTLQSDTTALEFHKKYLLF